MSALTAGPQSPPSLSVCPFTIRSSFKKSSKINQSSVQNQHKSMLT